MKNLKITPHFLERLKQRFGREFELNRVLITEGAKVWTRKNIHRCEDTNVRMRFMKKPENTFFVDNYKYGFRIGGNRDENGNLWLCTIYPLDM